MTTEQYKEWFGLNDEQWLYLNLCRGFAERKGDYALMEAIVLFSKNAKTQNPYIKFFEVLDWVQMNNYVHITDLETLDEYYNLHIIEYLLSPKGEMFTGIKASTQEELAKGIGKKNKQFDYSAFRKLISNMFFETLD